MERGIVLMMAQLKWLLLIFVGISFLLGTSDLPDLESGSWYAVLALFAVVSEQNWEQVLVDLLPTVQAAVRSFGRRRNLSAEDQDDLQGDIYEKLVTDDYHALRNFEGRSSMKTYLTTLVTRLAVDRQRQQEGRWRPSAAAKRLGEHAVAIDELITRRNYPIHEVWHIMKNRPGFTLTESETEALCEQLPRRAERFKQVNFKRDEMDEQGLDIDSVTDKRPDPETEYIMKQSGDTQKQARQLLAKFSTSLTSREQLVLRMSYEDDLKLSEMVRQLGMTRHKIESLIKSIHVRFRQLLLQNGIREEQLIMDITE
jgi:RNA polymerase sigma factor for flagellar operon FliA